ncbi:hypothetical protein H2201_001250 [Coniosporium apollinis]|uniref:Anaphase-promoting complex subunit 4 WD40 domain-containing protein n=1 Tax=Coniosporium apollinis TaxID=61459 RepID=A0ABQ9P2W6_9PEZI|nr:hypothetical protein H2201_001250 [Coniosporium apollinis]
MAPPPRTKSLPPPAFKAFFPKQKTTVYSDIPPARPSAPHNIRTLAWNPLGTLVATGAGDRTLRIWNPEKNQVKNSTELRGHAGAVERVAWNPVMEAELASVGSDGIVRFWDVRQRSEIGRVDVRGEGFTLAWKPDGAELVVGKKDDTLLCLDRANLSILSTHRQSLQTNQTFFGWAGQHLFLTTGDGTVKIARYPPPPESNFPTIHTLNGHTSSCYCIDISPAGTYVAVGGSDALISLWDTTDWVCQRTLTSIQGPVRSVSFSFDGSYVVGGTDEGSNGLEIAHTESGEAVWRIEERSPTPCVQWHPTRYALAYSVDSVGLKIVGGLGGV